MIDGKHHGIVCSKKKEPYYNKLRIIQLFEGDFNAGLKYLLGRLYMYHLVDSGFIQPETSTTCHGVRVKCHTMENQYVV